MARERQSNIELLRIISMLMVVVVHLDGASLGLPQPLGDLDAMTARDYWRLIVEAIAIIGVNCFTLISGYFGIRASLKGFCKFTFQCVFYAVMIYMVLVATGDRSWSWMEWGMQWLVYSHTDLWYVPAYLGLFILSPMLNAGVERLSRKQFGGFLAAFILFNLWLGWYNGGSFNPTGYTVIHLVMIYLIGRFIGLHFKTSLHSVKWPSLGVYLLSTVAIVLMSMYIETLKAFAYNSPAVVLSSVALFCFFASLNFSSTMINSLAASSFAVYLIHKSPGVFLKIKSVSIDMWQTNDLLTFSVFTILFALIIYQASCLVDILRRRIQELIFK